MFYHGWMTEVTVTNRPVITSKSQHFNHTTAKNYTTEAFTYWNVSDLLATEDMNGEKRQLQDVIPEAVTEYDSNICFPTTTTKKPTKTTKRISTIVPTVTYKAVEAKGAQTYGTFGMALFVVIILLVVISDLRYFERVLPIMKRNMKFGVKRIYKALHREDNIVAGMNQLVSLTVSLAQKRENAKISILSRISNRSRTSYKHMVSESDTELKLYTENSEVSATASYEGTESEAIIHAEDVV